MQEAELSALVLSVSAVFARVGGVFLIAPGFSSVRAPAQVRLFLALAVTMALWPLVSPPAIAALANRSPADLLALLGGETLIGVMLGLLARLLFMALGTLAIAVANAIGLGGIPGVSMDGGEASQAAASIFTVSALALLFIADLHYEIFRALIGSYSVLPPGAALDLGDALTSVATRFGETFLVALRLAAPFLIYSVIVNFAVGLINKLTPQLPIYFVALPAIAAGGLVMLFLSMREVLMAFGDAFLQLMGSL